MCIDGSTCSMTLIDPKTQSILLKRMHPRINNFNDVVMFLMECNMDIKYIGSGEAAKTLIYYITNYITKAALATPLWDALRHDDSCSVRWVPLGKGVPDLST